MARPLLLLALILASAAAALPARAFEPTGNAVADGLLRILQSGGFEEITVDGVGNEGDATLLSGLTATAPARNEALTIATVTIVDGLIDGRNGLRAEAIRYTDMRMSNTAVPESFSTAASVILAGPRLSPSQADASWLATVMGEYRGLELADLRAHPAAGRELRVGSIAIVRNADHPASGQIAFRDATVEASFFEGPTSATLTQLGYDRLTLDGTLAGDWQAETGTVLVTEASIAAEGMGALSLSLGATGLAPARMAAIRANLGQPTALLPLLQDVRVDNLTLALRDGGLTGRLIARAATRSGADAQSVRERTVAAADTALAMVGSPQLRQAGTEALRRFLADPGTLTIAIAPPDGVNAAQIVGGAILNPETLPALLDLKIAVEP